MKELIEALRCSATPPSKNVDCKSCRYRLLEPVGDKIPVPHDTVIDEVKYWESCDVDRIALDAADALEKQEVYKWIPVSERLPDNSKEDWVLAQVQEDNGYMWIPRVMEYREQMDDWYDESFGWLKERHGDVFKVIAWMPLPEPYEGEVKE